MTADETKSITNQFVKDVLKVVAEKAAAEKAVLSGGDIPPKVPRRLRQFVGFIHELEDKLTWRIYTCPEFDNGVDVLADEVLYHGQLEPDKKDGLPRNVVVVAHDAHVLYWSRRPPDATSGPDGGYPYPE